PQLLRPVVSDRAGSNTTVGESQSGSFTTAREDPLSSEDEGRSANNKNSRSNVRHVSDTSARGRKPDTLGFNLANFAPPSEGSSVSRSLGGDWGHNDSDWGSVSEVEQEWDHNLQRMVTVKKRPEPLDMMRSSPARAKVVEPNTVTSTQATKAAYLLDPTPKRQRTLRHVRKQTILREPTNASSVSTTDSLKSERSQNDARARTRPSAPKSESQSSNMTVNSMSSSRARREVWKAGGIPVVVVPDRLSSHKTKSREPSLRSHSSRRSSRTATSVSPTLNDTPSTRGEPPIVRRPNRGRSYSLSESSDERTMDYPPIVPARSSSLSAPTSRNGSRASSLTAESMKLHNALQEYLNKKKDSQKVPEIRFSENGPTTQALSSPSQSRRRSSSEHHDDGLNIKGYGSQNTPFLQTEAEENLDVPLPTDSSDEIPTTPPQPTRSLADVDSPLRNPRAPLSHRATRRLLISSPRQPSGTTPAHEKMALWWIIPLNTKTIKLSFSNSISFAYWSDQRHADYGTSIDTPRARLLSSPSREGSYYTSYDWPATERRTIGRTPSGNLRVMRHRSSFDSLRRSYNDDERPHSADGDVKRSFWRANSVQRRASKEKRRLSLGSRLEELQNLPRNGPKEVRDGVGDVIRSSTARDHYQSHESTTTY
ncbi:uncharacterized protein B0J16DRAFT_351820, partial [Fusarium flagelliforme]|uniref:uncharacterized protein n=1 Tax=Fusarium flagelliforme TaxID=2675880 RepID=UPI001E8E707A